MVRIDQKSIICCMEFEIKEILHSDLESLLKLSRNTFIHSYAHLNDPENFQLYLNERFNINQLENEWNNPNSFFYGVYITNALVAYFKINFPPAQTDKKFPESIEIERIYVESSYKRKGLGSAMINYAESLAREHEFSQIWLGVWRKNPSAVKFYKNCGFRHEGEHIFKVGTEEQTDYIFVKWL